jgi:sRNA-binding carbon storage regulator CsrA
MLAIQIRPGERFQISHAGVQAWVTVEKKGANFRVLVDGPRQIKVIRENLVKLTEQPATNAA